MELYGGRYRELGSDRAPRKEAPMCPCCKRTTHEADRSLRYGWCRRCFSARCQSHERAKLLCREHGGYALEAECDEEHLPGEA